MKYDITEEEKEENGLDFIDEMLDEILEDNEEIDEEVDLEDEDFDDDFDFDAVVCPYLPCGAATRIRIAT